VAADTRGNLNSVSESPAPSRMTLSVGEQKRHQLSNQKKKKCCFG
jgi:hypothetical protein